MIRVLVPLALAVFAVFPAAAQTVEFDAAEIAALVRHGPWPPPVAADPSNRVSGNPAAVAFGRRLFFETRLSPDGAVSCASCHDPAKDWSDGRPAGRARGVAVTRNTPSLADAGGRRWYGWGGAHDNLWAASLAPVFAPQEIGASAAHVATLLRGDPALRACYARAFARAPEAADDLAVAVDAAKALAAFQETIVSARTPFDAFRDALAAGDQARADSVLSSAARRGAKLFVGRGNCALCHLGPAFTSGEFHDIGVPFFTPGGGVDPGRHDGLRRLAASAFTRAGPWSDDPAKGAGEPARFVEPQHRNFGEFRIPGLRGTARTAPYMHDGSRATLRDVVRHYSALDPDRLHSDGEALLKPLGLADGEIDDLVAFLETLTAAATAPAAAEACPAQ